MSHTLFNAIIYPLIFILQNLMEQFYKLTGSYGLSIILLSVGVNTLLSPFYALADSWQNEEQLIIKKMKKRQEEIKAVFKGDERHFYLKTLYRHNGYNPFMSIRSSFGLLIQIPFFMAAYNFLSHYSALEGESFFFLSNLAQADSLIGAVNIMPFVMTGINLISAFRFTRGQDLRSRIQLFGMAGLFLVLLYNSASGLLLYWSCNNLFSLIRIFFKGSKLTRHLSNIPDFCGKIYKKTALPMKVLLPLFLGSLLLVAFLFVTKMFLLDSFMFLRVFLKLVFIYFGVIGTLYFFSRYQSIFPYQISSLFIAAMWLIIGSDLNNPLNNRSFPYFFISFILLLALNLYLPLLNKINRIIEERSLMTDQNSGVLVKRSIGSFFFLSVGVIPLLLINNAPGEIVLAASDALDLFLWSLIYLVGAAFFIYRAHPQEYRKPLSILFFIALLAAIINFLIFPGSYGYISNSLQFTLDVEDSDFMRLVNLLVLSALFLFVFGLLFMKKSVWFGKASALILASCIGITVISLGQLALNKKAFDEIAAQEKALVPEIPFSKEGPNTVLILLDRAMGSAVPAALEAFPELEEAYDGFTWYENTISYGNCTIVGLPALLGGYDYTPEAMELRPELSISEKMMEAWTVMPDAFLDLGHSVYLTDPEYSDMEAQSHSSTLEEYKNRDLTISQLHGRYRDYWLNQELPDISYDSILLRGKSFFLFSVFRMAPLFVREDLYNNGVWYSAAVDKELREKTANWGYFRETLNGWSTLEYLPELSLIQDNPSFSFIYNMTTHEDGAIGSDFKMSSAAIDFPKEDILKYGSKRDASNMYTNIACLEKVSEWFDWMKDQGVYDNTQILIVADHGQGYRAKKGTDDSIPYEVFEPLLLYKPFDAEGPLKVSSEFMTNADSAHLLLSSFGDFKNPYTGTALNGDEIKKTPQLVGEGNSKHDLHRGSSFFLHSAYRVTENIHNKDAWQLVY